MSINRVFADSSIASQIESSFNDHSVIGQSLEEQFYCLWQIRFQAGYKRNANVVTIMNDLYFRKYSGNLFQIRNNLTVVSSVFFKVLRQSTVTFNFDVLKTALFW